MIVQRRIFVFSGKELLSQSEQPPVQAKRLHPQQQMGRIRAGTRVHGPGTRALTDLAWPCPSIVTSLVTCGRWRSSTWSATWSFWRTNWKCAAVRARRRSECTSCLRERRSSVVCRVLVSCQERPEHRVRRTAQLCYCWKLKWSNMGFVVFRRYASHWLSRSTVCIHKFREKVRSMNTVNLSYLQGVPAPTVLNILLFCFSGVPLALGRHHQVHAARVQRPHHHVRPASHYGRRVRAIRREKVQLHSTMKFAWPYSTYVLWLDCFRERMDEQVRGIEAQLHNMEQDLTVLSEEIRDRIEQMTQEVERKVKYTPPFVCVWSFTFCNRELLFPRRWRRRSWTKWSGCRVWWMNLRSRFIPTHSCWRITRRSVLQLRTRTLYCGNLHVRLNLAKRFHWVIKLSSKIYDTIFQVYLSWVRYFQAEHGSTYM